MFRTSVIPLAALLVACQGIGQLGGLPDATDAPDPDDSQPRPHSDETDHDDSRPDDSRPEPDLDPCDGLDERGECDGDLARWCADDEIVEDDCRARGEVCVSDSSGAGCMAPEDEDEDEDEPEPEPEPLEGCNHPVVQEQLTLTNEARRNNGLSELICDEELTTAALLHSQDMCTRSYFSHRSRDGRSHSDRMRDAGAIFSTSGENIAWGQGTASEVHRTWMNSWGHRANILGRQYGRIGIGYEPCGGSPLWTQNFAD